MPRIGALRAAVLCASAAWGQASEQCSLQRGVNSAAANLVERPGVGSAEACCDLCQGTEGCVAFVYADFIRDCYLKSSTGGTWPAAGAVYGTPGTVLLAKTTPQPTTSSKEPAAPSTPEAASSTSTSATPTRSASTRPSEPSTTSESEWGTYYWGEWGKTTPWGRTTPPEGFLGPSTTTRNKAEATWGAGDASTTPDEARAPGPPGVGAGGHERGLSGGAVNGIVIGAAVVAVTLSLALGALCNFRQRRAWRAKGLSSDDLARSAGPPPALVATRIMEGEAGWATNASAEDFAAVGPPARVETPCTWMHWDTRTRFKSLEPVPDDIRHELQKMMDDSFQTIETGDRRDGPVPTRLVLRHAHRIEDCSLWLSYMDHRANIATKRAGRCTSLAQIGGEALTALGAANLANTMQESVNEVYLWHGTSPQGAVGIRESGFDINLAGSTTGAMYGNGAYFAESSSKSDEYARDDGDGIYRHLRCLLLCRVTLGEVLHLTQGGAGSHAMIRAAMESGLYDSVLGDRKASVGTYREFVAYNKLQVYPEYLVLYTRE